MQILNEYIAKVIVKYVTEFGNGILSETKATCSYKFMSWMHFNGK